MDSGKSYEIYLYKVCWVFVYLSHLNREQFSLTYEGKRIREETEVTYLGDVIDYRVAMVKHLEKNIAQAKPRTICCQ